MADIGTQSVDETGAGGTRAEGGDRHAGSTGLGPQGLAERQHERFARAVHRLVGRRLERDRGRDVKNPAAASGEHSGQQRASQGNHGG